MVLKGVMDKKTQNLEIGKIAILSQHRNLTFFVDEIFQLFSCLYGSKVPKWKNEIAPIFYYGKSPKTDEKDLKIPNIWSPDWGQPYWMTLYNTWEERLVCCLSNNTFNCTLYS